MSISMKKPLIPISGVVFDVDGTLLNTEPLSAHSIKRVLIEIEPSADISSSGNGSKSIADSFDWSLNQRILGLPRDKWIPLLIDELNIRHLITEDDFFHKWEENLAELADKVEKMPGVVETIEYFHSKRIPLAVATSSTSKGFNKKRLKHRDIFDKFTCFVCGDDAEIRQGKPAPDIYLLAAKRLGVNPRHCLAFEDALSGVKAATAAGMSCYAIPDPRLDLAPFLQNTSLPILTSMEMFDRSLFDLLPTSSSSVASSHVFDNATGKGVMGATAGNINTPFRQIRAIHTSDSIIVYQAYNDAIANAAVASNSFHGPLSQGLWSRDRMTWIKPSAIWMGYRCGWATMKDKNQSRVLSLELSKPKFFDLLRMGKLSHDGDDGDVDRCRDSNVVIQWDPERKFDVNNNNSKEAFTSKIHNVRSIQIGLRNEAVTMLLDPTFVLKIRDVSSRFQLVGKSLQSGVDDARTKDALWPDEQEQPVEIHDVEVRRALGIDSQ